MKIQSKILISQDPQRTEITLLINNGLSIIRQVVSGDHRLTADDIASELAMREFYKEHFADKYQNEEIEHLSTEIVSIREEINTAKEDVRKEIATVHNEVAQLSKVVFAKDLTEEEKEELNSQYDDYEVGVDYEAGQVINYDGELYEVVQPHTSAAHWKPGEVPTLYTPYLGGQIADKEIVHEWRKPSGTIGNYNTGDKALYNGVVYESVIDHNVWSPEEHPEGWKKVEV